MDERFFGVWTLEPSDDAEAEAPKQATYTMLPEGDEIWFHVRWTDAQAQRFETSFRGALDRPVAVTADGGVEYAMVTRFEAGAKSESNGGVAGDEASEPCLVTEVLDGQTVVQSAFRYLDGDALTVVQRAGGVDKRSVYRRASTKQVMVYRRDLAMRKGKIAAQCAHASMAVFFQRDQGTLDQLMVALDGPMAAWVKGRFAKVVLSVEGEAELLQIHALAKERGVPCALITDSGKTEFKGQPTRTTVALGPAAASEIDEITGPGGAVPTKLA